MDIESNIHLAEKLKGLGGATGDLLQSDGTSMVKLTGASQGSLLYRGASNLAHLAPGTSGYMMTSQGAGVNPAYEANAAVQVRTAWPGLLPYTAGRWYLFSIPGSPWAGTYAAYALVANRGIWMSFKPEQDFSIDTVAFYVSTAVGASTTKVLLYGDNTFLPYDLLGTTTAISTATTGVKTDTVAWDFVAGTPYHIAILSDAAVSVRGASVDSYRNDFAHFAVANYSTEVSSTVYKTGLTIGSPPDPVTSLTAGVSGNPLIFFKVA